MKRNYTSLIPLLLFTFLVLQVTLFPQTKISEVEQKEIIDTLCDKLEKLYPVRETGQKVSAEIRKNLSEGKYSGYTVLSEFIQHLNDDLGTLSNDGHLGILYNPALASELQKEKLGGKSKSYAELISESERWNNYGFKELKILPGNIGYMNLQMFFSLKYAAETAVSSMNFFSNCNALIIDLRRNGGGWDDMVTFLAAYFIDNEDVIFSIMHSTLDSSYSVSVPTAYVPGKKLTNISVIILTSRSTASAAEAFTNIMKHFCKNVSVVGERTAGAENPVEQVVLSREYILQIPVWQKIYSYDVKGWEGTGLKPDIEIESDSALTAAHLYLLNKLKKEAADENVKNKYQWYIEGVNALNNNVPVNDNLMRKYSGTFGNRKIYYENNGLYYQYKGRTKRKLVPITDEYFLIEGNDRIRIKFIKDNSNVIGLDEIFDDGTVTELRKETL